MLLHLMFFLAILRVSAQCPDGTYLSNPLCCLLCPAGTFVESPCAINLTKPVCKPCPANTYTRHENGFSRCRTCKSCTPSQVQTRECTSTKDRECGCLPGQFLDDEVLYCINCGTCPSGQGVARNCSGHQDTKCEPCKNGTFSDKEDLESCTVCSSCGVGEYIVQLCSASSDTVCGLKNYSSAAQPPVSSQFSSVSQFSTAQSGTPGVQVISLSTIVLTGILIFVAMVLASLSIFYLRGKLCCKREASETIAFDHVSCHSDDAPEREVLCASETPAHSRSSYGLRGRRSHRASRTVSKEMSDDGSTGSLKDDAAGDVRAARNKSLGEKGKMPVRDLPGDVIDELAFYLNPKGANDWVHLAGRLGFTQMAIDNMKLERQQGFQNLIAEWGTGVDATVSNLDFLLVNMKRDDAVAVLERFCRGK